MTAASSWLWPGMPREKPKPSRQAGAFQCITWHVRLTLVTVSSVTHHTITPHQYTNNDDDLTRNHSSSMAGLCSFFFHITLLTVLLQIIKYDYDRDRNHNLDTSHTDTITNHLTPPMLTSPFASNHHQNGSSSFIYLLSFFI